MPTLAGHQRGQLGVDIAGNDAACGYIDSHREETRTLIRRVQLFLCVCARVLNPERQNTYFNVSLDPKPTP